MEVIIGKSIEGTPAVLRAKIRFADGSMVLPDDIASIQYEVWKTSPPPSLQTPKWQNHWLAVQPPTKFTAATSLVVEDVLFDELQEWDLDETGYNFRTEIPAAHLGTVALNEFPKGQWVRVDLLFTPFAGAAFPVAFWLGLEQGLWGK